MTAKRVLFVCVENSNRSQMAEAFARMHGAGVVEAFSAGSSPSGKVNAKAVTAMRERGYDLTSHRSKTTSEVPPGSYEYVITMGCGDSCPFIPARYHEDWDLPDPRDLEPGEFRRVRDGIEERVQELLSRIQGAAKSP